MRLILAMLNIRFKVEECEDNVYSDSESEDEGKEKPEEKAKEKTMAPVILSCVGWNAKNMVQSMSLQ